MASTAMCGCETPTWCVDESVSTGVCLTASLSRCSPTAPCNVSPQRFEPIALLLPHAGASLQVRFHLEASSLTRGCTVATFCLLSSRVDICCSGEKREQGERAD
eukprot:422637-Hanusia_phi.AAC.2